VVESLSASRLLVFRFISWRSYLRLFKAVWSITATALVGQSLLLITCRVARNPPLCPSTVMHRQQQQAENFRKRLREIYLGFSRLGVLQILI
jgi:hypothetical protein